MSRVTIKGSPNIGAMLHSQPLSDQLEPLARKVYDEAKKDPNDEYTKTIRIYRHDSKGRRGRVSWRIGAAGRIGLRVEAKRGTLARALGLIK